MDSSVRIDDSDQRHTWKVQALRHHLRPEQHIQLPFQEAAQDLIVLQPFQEAALFLLQLHRTGPQLAGLAAGHDPSGHADLLAVDAAFLRAPGNDVADRLVVIPLYPQFSRTTTQTVVQGVTDSLRRIQWFPPVRTVQQYHDQSAWVSAVAGSIRRYREAHGEAEKLLFSLHGIPQRYAEKGDPYALQCQQSVAAIANSLGIGPGEWLLSFQSRVGREPWLKPYTDFVLRDWAEAGIRTVQVVCPGFAVDCLETLEEIAMQNEELFRKHGGERLEYIPALNDSDDHVALMADLARHAPSPAPAQED